MDDNQEGLNQLHAKQELRRQLDGMLQLWLKKRKRNKIKRFAPGTTTQSLDLVKEQWGYLGGQGGYGKKSTKKNKKTVQQD